MADTAATQASIEDGRTFVSVDKKKLRIRHLRTIVRSQQIC